jgi:hypothetical protein
LLAALKAASYTALRIILCSRKRIVTFRKSALLLAASVALLSGCSRDGEIDATGGVAITRTPCPAVAIPAYTGDITLFNPAGSRDSRAIDVVANITDVRSTCDFAGSDVNSNATFRIDARRANASGDRDVVLSYFGTVVQGGRVVVSKRVSRVNLHFGDGQLRATANGSAGAVVNKAAATLPVEVQDRITRKRKAGDSDAAIDPMSDPTVKAAVQRASFELLIGFQLTADQLQYNATR